MPKKNLSSAYSPTVPLFVLSRTSGQQLTYEQLRIVVQEVKEGELMKIVAFAGK